MRIVHQKQQESIEEREDLLHRMESYQKSLEQDKEIETQRKKEREQEIFEQVKKDISSEVC